MLIGNRVRIVYVSESNGLLGNVQIQDLIDKSRIHNTSKGITGLLIHRCNEFFQVLEGDRSLVDALYDRIYCDTRHRNVHLLLREEDVEPLFTDWSMGFISLEQDMIPGFKDALGGENLRGLRDEASRVKALISGFNQERWRCWIG